MALTLVFLGRLEDIAGAAALTVPLAADLDTVIAALDPALAQGLRGPRIRRAINGLLLAEGQAPALADGDEIAFLPPVSGG